MNAPASMDDASVGGQTAIFHGATQLEDAGLPVVQLLLDSGADLTICARLPGHYEHPGEVVECTVLGYAMLFPGAEGETVRLLLERNAPV